MSPEKETKKEQLPICKQSPAETPQLTLEPLRHLAKAALGATAIPELGTVKLTQVEFEGAGCPHYHFTVDCDNLLCSTAPNADEVPIPDDATLISATVLAQTPGLGPPVQVKLLPPHTLIPPLQALGKPITAWLQHQGILRQTPL